MDAHSSGDPLTLAIPIRHPECTPQSEVKRRQPQQVSQEVLAQQHYEFRQEQPRSGVISPRELPTPHQLLSTPSWPTAGSCSPPPIRQLSATSSQQHSTSSSQLQRGTSALRFYRIDTPASYSAGTGGRIATTTNSSEGKKSRGPNMNNHQKLTLAKLCSTHAAEYYSGNWGNFWQRMSDLLRQETGYNHRGVQLAVERWISIRPTEIFEELEDNNAFIEAIDKFTERWQYSQNEAAGRIAANKAKKEEIMTARRARHNIKMDNAADGDIVQIDNKNSPQEKKNELTAPTDRQAINLNAEDGKAESFSCIVDSSINESQTEVRSEEQGERQSEGRRKRRRSSGTDDDHWARIEAKFFELDAKMDLFLAKISKKLDDFVASGPK